MLRLTACEFKLLIRPLLILFAIVNKETLFTVIVENVFQTISGFLLFFNHLALFCQVHCYIIFNSIGKFGANNLTLKKAWLVPPA